MAKTRKKVEETGNVNAGDNVTYVEPATGFPFVYANKAVMNVNEMDGSIIFGEVVGMQDGKQMVIPKVKVIMATPFIYKLQDLLARTEELIEKKE